MSWLLRKRQGFIVGFVLLFPAILYFFFSLGDHFAQSLPFKGPKETVELTDSSGTWVDTIYHTLPHFSFTDQNGRKFSNREIKNKVVVADFFFTSCPTICPKMTFNLRELQSRLVGYSNYRILSHTVDPRHDTPEVLKEYAKNQQAEEGIWYFLTGEEEAIYKIAKEGYLVTADEDEGSQEGFVHSPNLVLIDQQGRVRGFYDGTSWAEVKDLIEDVKLLLREEYIPRKSPKRDAT